MGGTRVATRAMRVYWLGKALTAHEAREVQDLVGAIIHPVRIPHVLPVGKAIDAAADPAAVDERVVEHLLTRAGVAQDIGRHVLLVAPQDRDWCSAIARGLFRLTGFWPQLIQTVGSRRATGNPGRLRVLDLEGMMRP